MNYVIMEQEDLIMKKFLTVFLLCLFLFPMTAFAETTSLNLIDTLKDDDITPSSTTYSESDEKATVYLFRGKGCGYCHAFLEFLNSITEEYGKYFNLRSYEVWYNEENSNLLSTVSNYLGQPAGGVPYIVIGDKVFAGYASGYDEDIKSAIVALYNTPAGERYDVLKKIDEEGYVYVPSDNDTAGDTATTGSDTYANESRSTGETSDAIWTFLFVAVGTGAVILYDYKKYSKIQEDLEEIKKKIKK